MIGNSTKGSEEKLKALAKDAVMSFTGKLGLDNKIAIKNLLSEYCLVLQKREIEITSKEIVGLMMFHCPVYNIKDQKKISSEVTRRISGMDSHDLSGHFETVMHNDKPVRRSGAILRKFTPDPEIFIERNVLDI